MKNIIFLSLMVLGCAQASETIVYGATKTLTVACDLDSGRDLLFSTTIPADAVGLRRTYEYNSEFTFFISIPDVSAQPPFIDVIVEQGREHRNAHANCISELH